MTDDKITVGVVSVEDEDTGLDSIGQAETDEKNTPYAIVLPVGLSIGVPPGSNVLLLSINGDAGNRVGVPFQSENRFRGLKQYEVKLGNLKKKTSIFFDDDGNIKVAPNAENEKHVIIGEGEDNVATSSTIDSYFTIIDSILTALLTAVDTLTGSALEDVYNAAKVSAFPPSGEIPTTAASNLKADNQE